MRSFKTEGIVIRRRNIGEADRLLTIFTKESGKIRIKAPGVRRITSRRSPHIELLNLSALTLYSSSRSNIPLLTEAQTIRDFDFIKKDLKRIGFAFYICELVDKLCPPDQENRRIFYLLRETLEKLEFISEKEALVNEFEEKALSYLGFMPHEYQLSDRQAFIEKILEKKMRTSELLPLFAD
ncbi:MAG: DNA repair protein RecO [Patescibacteria group bacterium]